TLSSASDTLRRHRTHLPSGPAAISCRGQRTRTRWARRTWPSIATGAVLAPPVGAFDPRAIPPEALLIALALFALVALVQTLRLAWRTWSVGWRLGRQRMHAEEGETRAARLVRKLGYTILGSQVVVTYPVWIDDEEIAVTLRADYL